jgi:hypothetical protein
MAMNLTSLIQQKRNEAVRDICDISIAPAAKSKVRKILNSFALALLKGVEKSDSYWEDVHEAIAEITNPKV